MIVKETLFNPFNIRDTSVSHMLNGLLTDNGIWYMLTLYRTPDFTPFGEFSLMIMLKE